MTCCVFVGGPIQYAINEKGLFSQSLRSTLINVLERLETRGFRVLSAHRYERFGEVDMRGKFFEVCARDYAWMQECDAFVAVLPVDEHGVPVTTSGTSVELGWASAIGKPIVLVVEPSGAYSHLVAGLHAVTEVVRLDIGDPLLGERLCEALDTLTRARGTIRSASAA